MIDNFFKLYTHFGQSCSKHYYIAIVVCVKLYLSIFNVYILRCLLLSSQNCLRIKWLKSKKYLNIMFYSVERNIISEMQNLCQFDYVFRLYFISIVLIWIHFIWVFHDTCFCQIIWQIWSYTTQNKFCQKMLPVGFELTTSRSSVSSSATVPSHYLVVSVNH